MSLTQLHANPHDTISVLSASIYFRPFIPSFYNMSPFWYVFTISHLSKCFVPLPLALFTFALLWAYTHLSCFYPWHSLTFHNSHIWPHSFEMSNTLTCIVAFIIGFHYLNLQYALLHDLNNSSFLMLYHHILSSWLCLQSLFENPILDFPLLVLQSSSPSIQ